MLRSVLPANPAARRILIGTGFAAIGRGLTLPFLLIYLTQVRGLNAGTVGLLIGWTGLVALVLAPLGGSFVDRIGARRVVLPFFVVEAAGTGSLAFVNGTFTALLAVTVIAIGGSVLWPGQSTILATLVTPQERQRTFGLNFTLLNLGIGIGGMIAGTIVDASRPITFQLLYFGDAVSYVIPALILLSLPQAGQKVVAPVSPPPADSTSVTPAGGYRQVLRDRPFLAFFVFGLTLTTFGYAQIEVGFTAFATTVAEVSPRVVGFALAANTLIIVVAQLFVLRWLEGRSRTRALALVGGIFALSWLALAGAGLAGASAAPRLAILGVVACSMVFAIGETILSPVMPAITNALAPDELRGRYNAVAGMVWGVSAVIGPVAAGPLIGAGHSVTWVVLVVGGCLFASMLALRLHGRLTAGQDGRTGATPATTPTPIPVDLTPLSSSI